MFLETSNPYEHVLFKKNKIKIPISFACILEHDSDVIKKS